MLTVEVVQMDLSNPIGSVVPGAYGPVLAVLARTSEPLSGRKIAELADGRVSQRRANDVLGELSRSGVVLREDRPPSKLYRLNREHVAAPGIVALVDLWGSLLGRIRDELTSWEIRPVAACLFGSAARGGADSGSDIDVLLVRADQEDTLADDRLWMDQVDRLTARVHAWSGNACEVLELGLAELEQAVARDDRLVRDLRRDAIALAGHDVRALVRKQVRA